MLPGSEPLFKNFNQGFIKAFMLLSALFAIFSFFAALPLFLPLMKFLRRFTNLSSFSANAGGIDELASFLSLTVVLKRFAGPTLPFRDSATPLSCSGFISICLPTLSGIV